MSKPINSVSRGPRESNFELLRILAMLMVLALHVNFATDKFLWPLAFHADPASAWTRSILEYTAIPAVDIFVMISGWFRIRPCRKGIISFLLQIIYFSIISGILAWLTTGNPSSLHPANLWSAVWVPWFIPTYLLLYIISPVLNAFLDSNSPKRVLGSTLFLFISGWVINLSSTTDPFNGGYNLFTFLILYLLSASLHGYREVGVFSIIFRPLTLIFIFIIATALNLAAFRIWHSPWIWSYANPLIILQAITIILSGASLNTKSWSARLKRFINGVAASAFAAYLLHINPALFGPCFKTWGQHLWANFSGPFLILILLAYILLWYVAATFLDLPRRRLNIFLQKLMERK